MSVKELRALLRKCNADQNRGELTDQFRDWIIVNEQTFHNEIQTEFKQGDYHVSLVYYGMVYTILKHTGCYFMGKNSDTDGLGLQIMDAYLSAALRKAGMAALLRRLVWITAVGCHDQRRQRRYDSRPLRPAEHGAQRIHELLL